MSVEKAQDLMVIVNKLGMHARPAMSFVELASAFPCDVTLKRTDGDFLDPVDGKSIMQLMMLAATKGTQLEISTNGEQAKAACAALCELVSNGFDEA